MKSDICQKDDDDPLIKKKDKKIRRKRLYDTTVCHSKYSLENFRILGDISFKEFKEKISLQDTKNSEVEDERYLKRLDPKEWRKQDHYAVLGLKDLRYNATESDIKKAYRKRVLKHHPDKRPPEEHTDKDSDYFTCITRAWEVLGNKGIRRSYDSIDPYFDDSIPSSCKQNFFDTFCDVFKRNERWSEVSIVPALGDENTTREEVERFYNFWFNFRSWRDFSYEMEEADSNMDREERRFVDKQNKANRMKLKKEEMSRIRKLVDLAYNNDPRIKKFKIEDKERKIAAKRAKEEEIKANKLLAAQQAKEAEDKERKVKEDELAKIQKEQESIKAEQDRIKKSAKRVKKSIRDLCKQNEYYVKNGDSKVDHMTSLEQICESLSLEDLKSFHQQLLDNGRSSFTKKMDEVKKIIQEERLNSLNEHTTPKQNGVCNGVNGETKPWLQKELQLLVKAVNLFPAGTNQRWETVATFLSQHNSDKSVIRSSAEVLAKVKEIQKMKQNPNSEESKTFVKNNFCSSETTARTWNNTEQQQLEKSLKIYNTNTDDRWDKIAASIPTRTKDEVMQRYKELVEAVKAKRATQQQATKATSSKS